MAVTVLLILDHGRSAAAIAQDLGESTAHRYAQTCQRQGLVALPAKEALGYAGRLSSVQLAELRAETERTLYTDCCQLVDWLALPTGCCTRCRA